MKKILLLILILTICVFNYGQSGGSGTKVSYEEDKLTNMKSGIFNVLDYGATGDGTTSDYTAIQNTVIAAEAYGQPAIVYFPVPISDYSINDTIEVNSDFITVKGAGLGSKIKNDGTTPTFIFNSAGYFTIKDLYIEGNGGAYGAGSTNGAGIILNNSNYGLIENVMIRYHSYGIYCQNGTWGTDFISVQCRHNLIDGLHSVSNSGEANTGQNGNGFNIVGGSYSTNGNDGIEWMAASLSVNGAKIETNKGSGLQIGSLLGTGSVISANINGNYMESNDSSAIKIIGGVSPYRAVTGIVIEGNYMLSGNTIGDVSLITQDVPNGTYANSFQNSKIGINHYTLTGGRTTTAITTEASTPDVIIKYPAYGEDFPISIGGDATIIYNGVAASSYDVTATADGTGAATWYTGVNNISVTSASANYIVNLPIASTATRGLVLTGNVGANGFELRVAASQLTTVYLNGVTTNVEAAIPANSSFEVRCIDATHWILRAWTNLGAVITAIIPDAI